jgi:hypothetical protein
LTKQQKQKATVRSLPPARARYDKTPITKPILANPLENLKNAKVLLHSLLRSLHAKGLSTVLKPCSYNDPSLLMRFMPF